MGDSIKAPTLSRGPRSEHGKSLMETLQPAPSVSALIGLVVIHLAPCGGLGSLIFLVGREDSSFLSFLLGSSFVLYGVHQFAQALLRRLPVRVLADGTVTNILNSAPASECRAVVIRHDAHCVFYTALQFPTCEMVVSTHSLYNQDQRWAQELGERFRVPVFVGGRRLPRQKKHSRAAENKVDGSSKRGIKQ